MVKSLDISTTGVLLELENEEQLNIISNAKEHKAKNLKYYLVPCQKAMK